MGPRAREWLLNMYNECMDQIRISKMWHKIHIISLLKLERPPTGVQNFKPITLLRHTYKVLKTIILNKVLVPTVFNIYTNDQPTNLNTKHFLYADDLAITSQQDTFRKMEETWHFPRGKCPRTTSKTN